MATTQGGSERGEEHLQKIIPLDGGLDLVTPRLLTEPGRLVDCLNYECVDQVGYKKIDGFERYDGGVMASAVSVGYIIFPNDTASLTTDGFAPGLMCWLWFTDEPGVNQIPITITRLYDTTYDGNPGYCRMEYTSENSVVIGTLLSATAAPDLVVVLNPDRTIGVRPHEDPIGTPVITVDDASASGSVTATDATRALVDALPGDVFPYGLQMYKDRMHVIADCQYVYLALRLAALPSITVPTTVHNWYVGTYLKAGTYEAEILDWKWLRGSFDALGTLDADRAWAKVLIRKYVTGTYSEAAQCTLNTTGTGYAGTSYWSIYSSLTGVTGAPTDAEDVWGGVLYRGIQEPEERTTSNDWEQLPMGYEVYFNAGQSTIVPRELTRATTQAQLDAESETVTSVPIPSVSDSFAGIDGAYTSDANAAAGYATFPASFTAALDSASYTLDTDDASGVYTTYTVGVPSQWSGGAGITFKNFGLSIPEDAIIRRVRFTGKVWCYSASGTLAVPFTSVELVGVTGGTRLDFPVTIPNTATYLAPYDISLGDPTGKWGLSEITPAQINDSSFGVKIVPQNISIAVGFVQWMFFDMLEIEVDFFRPVGKFFFSDGSSEIETNLVRIHLDKGSWTDSDNPAEGVAHVYDLELLDPTPARNYIKVGDKIRIATGSTDIATVTAVKASFLPSHKDVRESDRRVQMLTANYYLNPDWEAIYGCHGLGRAFSYDGTYFRKIYSAYDSQLDKPRHIASYRSYLVMGYESGNVLLSKVGESGPEPENFKPLEGAREFSFVDRVTGLTELVDTSLGVFCSQSINRIVLNPNAPDPASLFYTSVISPNSGAIEYTVSTFGNMTLLCDQFGIRSVEQTDVFGDFIGRPVSFPVSPWLRPRLSAKKYWLDSKEAQRPLFAYAVRAKNQYRVWFDDGYVLCMNMNTTEEPPRFTFLRYGLNFGSSNFVPLTPIAHTRISDSEGTERIHIAHWNRLGDVDTAENSATLFKYVFEMERGWSFDGQDFPALLTLNLSFLETPYDYDQIRKVELHALDYNNTTLFAAFGTKYGEEQSYSGMAFSSTWVPAGRNTNAAVSTDYIPFAKMINCGNRGRPLYLKFKNATTATGDTSVSAIEPPHILQALLVQYTPARQET